MPLFPYQSACVAVLGVHDDEIRLLKLKEQKNKIIITEIVRITLPHLQVKSGEEMYQAEITSAIRQLVEKARVKYCVAGIIFASD